MPDRATGSFTMLTYDYQTGRTFTTMPELTKDESIVALADAQARFEKATREYNEARQALEKCSRSIQAKMPWLKQAVDFCED